MSRRRAERVTQRLVVPPLPPMAATAHDLCNVLGALELRFGVLESDPTCRWAQDENLVAIRALLRQGMHLARALEVSSTSDASLAVPTLARSASRPSPRPVTPKRR